MKTTVLYVRIPEDLKRWLDELAEDSGMPLAKICAALLDDQREHATVIAMQRIEIVRQ